MKRVTVTLSEDTLSYMECLQAETNRHRSDLIREACYLYIEERRRASLREKMKAGYQEMAEINRLLAEELASDFDCVPRALSAGDYHSMDPWRKA
ncbi:MAG: CopG family transcriptional regulator [Bacillota bacterium]